jgi:hypothetical protein
MRSPCSLLLIKWSCTCSLLLTNWCCTCPFLHTKWCCSCSLLLPNPLLTLVLSPPPAAVLFLLRPPLPPTNTGPFLAPPTTISSPVYSSAPSNAVLVPCYTTIATHVSSCSPSNAPPRFVLLPHSCCHFSLLLRQSLLSLFLAPSPTIATLFLARPPTIIVPLFPAPNRCCYSSPKHALFPCSAPNC